MNKLLWSSSLALATAAFLTACGDETTNITETTGPTSVTKFKDLGECTADNSGDMVYVKDQASIYFCADSVWKEMSASTANGSDGKDGSDGKNGSDGKDGKNGKSAYELSGSKLSLEDWLKSLNGDNGESCTAVENAKENGYDIVCGDKVKGTLKNGTSGTSCEIVNDKDGIVTLKCGDVETELYKAVCGATPYDPAKKFCFDMELYDLCDGEIYTPGKDLCESGKLQKFCYFKEDSPIRYDVQTHFCYGEKVYELCGGEDYDPTKYDCVDNQKQKKKTCKGIQYNQENEFCAMWGSVEFGTYKMVTIGTGDKAQTWMAQNLDYEVTGSSCYNEDCSQYGRYYTWNAAINNSTPDVNGNIQGVCPDGWHLPTKGEWEQLISNVEENEKGIAGMLLKDSVGWRGDKEYKGTNATGFTALPAGYMLSDTDRSDDKQRAFFWSTTESETEGDAYYMVLSYNYAGAVVSNNNTDHNISKTSRLSIRCLKD